MQRQKLFIILAAMVTLTITLFTANAILSRDEVEPRLREAITDQQIMIEMSKLGQRQVSDHALRVIAANIATTTASDSMNLKDYYQKTYGKGEFRETNSDLEELKNTSAGFDELYRSTIQSYLEDNLSNLEQIQKESKNKELKDTVTEAIDNVEASLDQL